MTTASRVEIATAEPCEDGTSDAFPRTVYAAALGVGAANPRQLLAR